MNREFHQTAWSDELLAAWLRILDLALREDLASRGDCTTLALVPEAAQGRAAIVARKPGVLAGEAAVAATAARFDPRLQWTPLLHDAAAVAAGQPIGHLAGPARAMLGAERLLLNLLGRLSGIASLMRRYVDLIAGTKAAIYDTRKTTPGWRSLEKYAVRCGGGRNHRAGLDEAVLIKDNHLAVGRNYVRKAKPATRRPRRCSRTRQFFAEHFGETGREMIVEIEVDTLDQLDEVLAVGPDIVLLDNMPPAVLRESVARRDARNPAVELEASGGIDLSTVRSIAETGIERISAGASDAFRRGARFWSGLGMTERRRFEI